MKFYPVAEPNIGELEKKYVLNCLNTSWISSHGKYVKEFEKEFAKFHNVKYAITTANGTVSLHLILLALGVEPGDEVIIPDFTYVAAANTVSYVGAKPVFVDCDPYTYNIDPDQIEQKINKKTKAIMAVHLYGNPCNLQKLVKISKKYKIYLIEDAAEALGALYKNKKIGSFGIASSFSFFANKTITTGEGGMIITNSKKLYDKIALLKNQGQNINKFKYYHSILGYNYRLTNIQAAIGLAQFKKLKKFLKQKKKINQYYKIFLEPAIKKNKIIPQAITTNSSSAYWMNAFLFPKTSISKIEKYLKKFNIETRPFFVPMHKLPFYKETLRVKNYFPNSCIIYKNGLILPSGTKLIEKDVKYISEKLLNLIL